jgi:large subunit ribosomal protein L4
LGFTRKVLVVDHLANRKLLLAARNIAEVDLIPSLQVTPYQLLNARHVVFSKAAIEALEEVLKK